LSGWGTVAYDGAALCGAGRVRVVLVSRRVQTLLFTDIVSSTDRLPELGDAAWASLLARHHEAIRTVLAAHRGREVNTAGDGFLARFEASPRPGGRPPVATRISPPSRTSSGPTSKP